MERFFGYSRLLTSGVPVPSATITVYLTGTVTPATLYSDDLPAPTPLGNPFTADVNGFFYFYAADGQYDVRISGGTGPTIPAPYTWGDVLLGMPEVEFVNVKDYGALGNSTIGTDGADDTNAFVLAYAAAVALNKNLFIPKGGYRITAPLTWNRQIGVRGGGRGTSPDTGTTIWKNGNFVAITITNGSHQAQIGDFNCRSAGGVDASDGIVVVFGSDGGRLFNITSRRHGGAGIRITFAVINTFENISCIENLGDGLVLDPSAAQNVSGCIFNLLDLKANGGDGLDIIGNGVGGGGGAFCNQFNSVVSQDNTGVALRSKGVFDTFVNFYSESNVGGDFVFDAASDNNWLSITSMSAAYETGLVDNGTNNVVVDMYHGVHGTWTPTIGGSGGTSGQTYSTRVGRYTKIGRLVVCHFDVLFVAEGVITANVQLEGLPFTALSGASFNWAIGGVVLFENLATNWIALGLVILNNSKVASVVGLQAAAATNNTPLTAADIANNTELRGTFAYFSNE